MATNYDALLYTLTEFASVFNDFFNGAPADVTFKYKDQNGAIQTKLVPNVAKVKQQLAAQAVSESQMADKLKEYYSKIKVDSIKEQILTNLDSNYYKKGEVDTLVEAEFKKFNIMTEEEYEAIKKVNRNVFNATGVVEYGNTYIGLESDYKFTLRDLWNHTWPGCCNFRQQTDPAKYAHYSKAAKVLYWSREGWSFVGGRFNPKLNINGSLITIRGINESKAFETCVKNVIEFPEAPTIKTTVNDSSKLSSSLEQDDFILLKDFDRELVYNNDFSYELNTWSIYDNENVLEYDKNNKRAKIVFEKNTPGRSHIVKKGDKFLANLKYRVEVEYEPGSMNAAFDPAMWVRKDNNSYILNNIRPTKIDGYNVTYEFVSPVPIDNGYLIFTYVYSTYKDQKKGDYWFVKSVSIKQAEEQPIVALSNVDTGADIYDNVNKFEARNSVSRQDFVFIENWVEKISDKGIIYPYGNVQYQGVDVEGLKGITEGTFEGADTYSLFGGWQKPGDLTGRGYLLKNINNDDILNLASNPEHKLFLKNGELYQERYRIRVIRDYRNNLGHDLTNPNDVLGYRRTRLLSTYITPQGAYVKETSYGQRFPSGKTVGAYNAYRRYNLIEQPYTFKHDWGVLPPVEIGCGFNTYATPIIVVQRRNDGIFNKLFNPEGTARAYDKANSKLLEFSEYAVDDTFITSLEDCFDPSKIAATTADDNVVPADDSAANNKSGYINSRISGHEMGLFADEINEKDIEDVRMIAKKKPYEDSLNEWLAKSISGEIRGKENLRKINFTIINEKVLFTSSSADSENAAYSLYVSNGTDEYILKHGMGKTVYGNPGDIVEIFDKNGNYVKLIYKDNESLRRQTFNYPFISYGLPWKDGTTVELTVIVSTSTDYKENNDYTQTDIIGDPRPLGDRVQIDTAKTNSGTVNKNMYIKHSNGHYYRALSNRGNLTNIEDDINKNSSQYLDLGTNGSIGGYPQEWLNRGFAGTSFLVNDGGESTLPIDIPIQKYSSKTDSAKSLVVRLSKKSREGFRTVLINTKTGEMIGEVPYNTNHGEAFAGLDAARNGHFSATPSKSGNGISTVNNLVYLNLEYTTNGSTKTWINENDLDFIIAVIIYETKANNMELADNVAIPTAVSNDVYVSNYHRGYGEEIVSNLLNKVGCWGIAGLTVHGFNNKTGSNVFQTNNYYTISHNAFDKSRKLDGDFAAKWIASLVNLNNRAYLQFVFKELKYDSSTKTWGDDNKFQIVNRISSTIDNNGKTILIGQKKIPLPFFITEN